jgi:hypothetical protein
MSSDSEARQLRHRANSLASVHLAVISLSPASIQRLAIPPLLSSKTQYRQRLTY